MKLVAFTLAHARLDTLHYLLENFFHFTDYPTKDFHVFDGHYPKTDSQDLQDLCAHYKVTYVDPGPNAGNVEGIKRAYAYMKPNDDDIVWGHDPDVRLSTYGWNRDVLKAYEYLPNLAVLYLRHHMFDKDFGIQFLKMHDLDLVRYEGKVSWEIAAVRYSFAKKYPPRQPENILWGWLEDCMTEDMRKDGKIALGLANHFCEQVRADLDYTIWKLETCKFQTKLNFGPWLEEKMRNGR